MRATHLIIPVLALTLSSALAKDEEVEKMELETTEAKSSYALGMQVGDGMKSQGVELDIDAYVQGLKDTLAGGETLLSQEEVTQVMTDFQRDMQKKMAVKREKDAAENKEKGGKFLKKNAEREGVTVTISGLQYEVLEEGEGGPKPTLADSVTVHYTGKLMDGTVFDSSVARGEPAKFNLRGVIPGWTEVLQLMSPGDKYRAIIPANLAYGDRGAPPKIGPGAVLDFEVELISVESGGGNKVNIKPAGLNK